MIYYLYQIGDEENGDFYINSAQNPMTMIEAGKALAKKYPGTDYTVMQGTETLWSSRELDVKFRLMRREGDLSLLILPGTNAEALISAGENMSELNPGLILEVEGPEGIVWSNKKDASIGEAGDAHENR